MEAVVKEVVQATSTVCLPRLLVKDMDFKPGQFVLVKSVIEGKTVVKPYSIASSPSVKDHIELCIRKAGPVSGYMCSLKPGDKLDVMGPAGHFVLKEPVLSDIVFVATGTGISALLPMIDTIFEKGTDKEVWLFFGNKTEDEIIYRDRFETLANKHKNFHFAPVLSRADEKWQGERGHVQDALRKYIFNPSDKEIYVCGILAMVEEVAKIAEEMGFKKEKIYFEKYV
ncbi:MAG: FAD-dependent oxidoreductase [Candidatus Aenigmarchaeota archaeon]|nr:FAD-dependent oxidoreductase [Candidatus Aenigmarchaeota archaeon]